MACLRTPTPPPAHAPYPHTQPHPPLTVCNSPPSRCACLRQSGWFRFLPGTPAASAAAPGGAEAAGGGGKEWKPLRAEAYVSVGGRPGLVWSATIQLAPLQWVRGFASYLRGRGSTRWKLCTLWRVHDVEGERSLDTLSLLRFLAGELAGGRAG